MWRWALRAVSSTSASRRATRGRRRARGPTARTARRPRTRSRRRRRRRPRGGPGSGCRRGSGEDGRTVSRRRGSRGHLNRGSPPRQSPYRARPAQRRSRPSSSGCQRRGEAVRFAEQGQVAGAGEPGDQGGAQARGGGLRLLLGEAAVLGSRRGSRWGRRRRLLRVGEADERLPQDARQVRRRRPGAGTARATGRSPRRRPGTRARTARRRSSGSGRGWLRDSERRLPRSTGCRPRWPRRRR